MNELNVKFPFVKMHGTGNDFVVTEKSKMPSEVDYRSLSKAVCNRKYGIGSDGLIIIANHDKFDFEMLFFNPDGSPSEMCGNGIRCLGKYVFDHGLTAKLNLSIATGAGRIDLKMEAGADNKIELVEVAMGKPDFAREKIPVAGKGQTALAESIKLSNGMELEFHAVSMGNPHAVIIVDDVDNYPVREFGPMVEMHELFPNKVNVEFVRHISPEKIKIRIWERGAGETLSCGTGICASAAVLRRLGLVGKSLKVLVSGGELDVRFDKDDVIYLKGPAVEVFSGVLS